MTTLPVCYWCNRAIETLDLAFALVTLKRPVTKDEWDWKEQDKPREEEYEDKRPFHVVCLEAIRGPTSSAAEDDRKI